MWIKKENEEILKEEVIFKEKLNKRRFWISLMSFGIVFMIGVLFYLRFYFTGYDQVNPSSLAPSLEEIYIRIPGDLFFTTILSSLGFFYVYFFGYKYLFLTNETEMCNNCNSKRLISKKHLDQRCSCGGTYYSLNHYSWKEEKTTLKTSE